MGIKRGLRQGPTENFKIKIGRKATAEDRKDFFFERKDGNHQRKIVKLRHFRLCKTSREAPEWKGDKNNYILAKELHAVYGAEPTMLEVSLPYDTVDMNFPTEYARYDGKKKLCSGDGVHAVEVVRESVTKPITCNPETCAYSKAGKCKATGRLYVTLSRAPRIGSVAVFRTAGWNSVSNILSSLTEIHEHTGGILRGIPMRLELLFKDSAEYGEVPHVNIETVASDWDMIADQRMKELETRHKMGLDIKLIEAQAIINGDVVDHDDPAEIEAEFYPDEKEAFAAQAPETIADAILSGPGPEVSVETAEVVPRTGVTHYCGCRKALSTQAEVDSGECASCADLNAQSAAYDAKVAAEKGAAEKAAAEPVVEKPKEKFCTDCGGRLLNKTEMLSGICASCVDKRKASSKQGKLSTDKPAKLTDEEYRKAMKEAAESPEEDAEDLLEEDSF